MEFLSLFNEIQRLSLKEKKSLSEKMIKLQEESGELAEEVLIHLKASGSQKKISKSGIAEESVDLILVALSIFFKEGGTIEELLKLLKKKSKKWEKHQK